MVPSTLAVSTCRAWFQPPDSLPNAPACCSACQAKCAELEAALQVRHRQGARGSNARSGAAQQQRHATPLRLLQFAVPAYNRVC